MQALEKICPREDWLLPFPWRKPCLSFPSRSHCQVWKDVAVAKLYGFGARYGNNLVQFGPLQI
jgi:hypothetical protein